MQFSRTSKADVRLKAACGMLSRFCGLYIFSKVTRIEIAGGIMDPAWQGKKREVFKLKIMEHIGSNI